jgi:putative ABC transport system permease protein
MKAAPRLRALSRIAWRDARLSRGRSLLVLAMVALPVTALTAGLVFFNAYAPTVAQRIADVLGRADITIVGDDPAALARIAADAPPGSIVTVRTTVTTATVVNGRRNTVMVDDVLPDDRLLAPRYDMIDGRLPERADETVVAPSVLEDFGLQIGDEIVFDEPAQLRLAITGTALRPERLAEPFALVPSGALDGIPGAAVSAVFVDLAPGAGVGDMRVDDTLSTVVPADLADDPDERPVAFGSMFALAALGLAETGLVVAAAFVVGVQRRLQRVGLVAAIGGEPGHTRTMVLLEGVVVGLLGGAVGVGLGVLAMRLLSSRLSEVAGRVIGDAPLPLAMLAAAVALGTVAAAFAVLGQARLAKRVAVVDALAGRIPAPTPPGRVARRGLLVALTGGVIIAVGTNLGNEGVQVLGVGAMVAGTLAAVPLLVAAVGRTAAALPLPLRLAARDTARHGRRAGAAVAGAALALALPVTAATLTLGEEALARAEPPLATDHILVSAQSRAAVADTPVIDRAITSLVDVDGVAPLTVATFGTADGARSASGGPAQVFAGTAPPTADDGPLGGLTVGGADLLRVLHAEDRIADLRAGRVVAIGDDVLDTDVVYVAPPAPGRDPIALRAAASHGPGYDVLPSFVISPERAAELGLVVSSPTQLLYRTATPVDTATLDQIRSAIATVDGVWVLGAEDTLAGSATTQGVMLAVAIPVALATLAVSTAMVIAESRRDQAVLAAVGAAPGVRRRIVGSAALLLGLLSAVIAVPAGFLPVALMLGLSEPAYPLVVPWMTIAGVLGAAVLAGVGGFALSRQPPSDLLLRPLT